MQVFSFKGGVHPAHNKATTANLAVEKCGDVDKVYIPLSQHIGAPCTALVKKDDLVKVGQKIGEPQGFVSSPVHSSVSGKVVKIVKMNNPGGNPVDCVEIENDFQYTLHEDIHPYGTVDELSKEELLNIVKEIGLVGKGGATFPTHVKLSPPPEKPIDAVILNGAECEPYLTADHRLMLENPEDVIEGLRAFMKILGVTQGYIGIEDNKPDCIEKMIELTKNLENIKVMPLKTKYPQGAEKQLIKACLNREVPSGGLPMDAGVVVNNVATAAQMAKSLRTGIPFIERICTVTGGAIKEPKNVMIRMGTLYSDIIKFAGGFKETPGKVISGGPMMGLALSDLDIPCNKGTSGILCFTEKEAEIGPSTNCIRCGKCVDICPAHLQPLYISAYTIKNNYDKANEYRALDCIECGSCSFICPAKRPLLQTIRVAKKEIMAKKRKEKK